MQRTNTFRVIWLQVLCEDIVLYCKMKPFRLQLFAILYFVTLLGMFSGIHISKNKSKHKFRSIRQSYAML